MMTSETLFCADDSTYRHRLSYTSSGNSSTSKQNNKNNLDRSIIPMTTKLDDLILPPEYSDDVYKDLTWLARLFDCEIATAKAGGGANHHHPAVAAAQVVNKGQIVCRGTKSNLEKIRYATKLFCRHQNANDKRSYIPNDGNDTYFKDEVFIPKDRVDKLLGEEGKLLFEKINSTMKVALHKTYSWKSKKSRFTILGVCREDCLKVKALVKSIVSTDAPPQEPPGQKQQPKTKRMGHERSLSNEFNKENIPVSVNNSTSQHKLLLNRQEHKVPHQCINKNTDVQGSNNQNVIYCQMTIHYWKKHIRKRIYNNEDEERRKEETAPDTVPWLIPNGCTNLMIADVTVNNFGTVQENVLKPFTLFSVLKTRKTGTYFVSMSFQSAAEAVSLTKSIENLSATGGMQNVYYLRHTFEHEKKKKRKMNDESNRNDERTMMAIPTKQINQHLLVRPLTDITLKKALRVVAHYNGDIFIWKKSCGLVFLLEIHLESIEDAENCAQAIQQTTVNPEGGAAVVEYVHSKFDFVKI